MSIRSCLTHRDPLRRLMPTPLVTNLPAMGRTVRLETNSPAVIDQTRRLFEPYPGSPSGEPEFLWRIVSGPRAALQAGWPERSAFSGEGLRLVNLGQHSFFAVDLEVREAVGFLAEELAEDDPGYGSVFVAALFDLTAAALRLTQLSAACVSIGNRGLLIFGPPRSGKTTSSYVAGKRGLKFHADQVTYLDYEHYELRAWGQFWPAAFRVETQQFLPELLSARPFTYGDLTFLCLDTSSVLSGAGSVSPVSCIFLQRQAAETPQLTRLLPEDFAGRLRESLPFKEDERFEPQRAAILRALAVLPAYRLAYGNDPTVAVVFYRSLLNAHDLLEARV